MKSDVSSTDMLIEIIHCEIRFLMPTKVTTKFSENVKWPSTWFPLNISSYKIYQQLLKRLSENFHMNINIIYYLTKE